MNAIPNTPANGYEQVKDALVEDNLIVACKVPSTIGLAHDKGCTLPPLGVTMRKNVVYAPERPLVDLRSEMPEWKWDGNKFHAKELGADLPGVSLQTMEKPTGRLRPLQRSQAGPLWWRS
jgi:hypothetical protein